MNNCINEETLSIYCDGVLDKVAQLEVENHLQECWACRRTVSDYRNLNAGIKGLPDIELPSGFHAEIIKRLKNEAAPVVGKTRPQWVKIAVAAVLLIAVAAPGYGMYFLGTNAKSSDLVVTQGLLTDQAAPSPQSTQKGKAENGVLKSTANESVGSQGSSGSGVSGSGELKGGDSPVSPGMNYDSNTRLSRTPSLPNSASISGYSAPDALTGTADSSVSAQSIYPTILIPLKAVDAIAAGRGILLKALETPSLEINYYWSSTGKVVVDFSALPGDARNFVAQLESFGVLNQAEQNWNLTDLDGKLHVVINIYLT